MGAGACWKWCDTSCGSQLSGKTDRGGRTCQRCIPVWDVKTLLRLWEKTTLRESKVVTISSEVSILRSIIISFSPTRNGLCKLSVWSIWTWNAFQGAMKGIRSLRCHPVDRKRTAWSSRHRAMLQRFVAIQQQRETLFCLQTPVLSLESNILAPFLLTASPIVDQDECRCLRMATAQEFIILPRIPEINQEKTFLPADSSTSFKDFCQTIRTAIPIASNSKIELFLSFGKDDGDVYQLNESNWKFFCEWSTRLECSYFVLM